MSQTRIKRSPQFASQTLQSQTPRYDYGKVDDGIGSLPRPRFVPQEDLYTPDSQYQPEPPSPFAVEPQLDQMQTVMNRLQTPRVQEDIPLPQMIQPEYRQLQFQSSPFMNPEQLAYMAQLNQNNMAGANAALDEVQYNPQVQAANTYRQVVNPLMGGLLGMFGMGGAQRNMELTDRSIYNDTKSYYDMMDNVAARRMALAKQAYETQSDYDPYSLAAQDKRMRAEGYMNQVRNSMAQGYNRNQMEQYKAQIQKQKDLQTADHQDTADLLNALRLRDSGRRMDLQDKQYQEKLRQYDEKVRQFNQTFSQKDRFEEGKNNRFHDGEAGKSVRQGVSEAGKDKRQKNSLDWKTNAFNAKAQNQAINQEYGQKAGAIRSGKNADNIPAHAQPVLLGQSNQINAAASDSFQRALVHWNQLTPEQKKASKAGFIKKFGVDPDV